MGVCGPTNKTRKTKKPCICICRGGQHTKYNASSQAKCDEYCRDMAEEIASIGDSPFASAALSSRQGNGRRLSGSARVRAMAVMTSVSPTETGLVNTPWDSNTIVPSLRT